MLALASHAIDEAGFADWLREHVRFRESTGSS